MFRRKKNPNQTEMIDFAIGFFSSVWITCNPRRVIAQFDGTSRELDIPNEVRKVCIWRSEVLRSYYADENFKYSEYDEIYFFQMENCVYSYKNLCIENKKEGHTDLVKFYDPNIFEKKDDTLYYNYHRYTKPPPPNISFSVSFRSFTNSNVSLESSLIKGNDITKAVSFPYGYAILVNGEVKYSIRYDATSEDFSELKSFDLPRLRITDITIIKCTIFFKTNLGWSHYYRFNIVEFYSYTKGYKPHPCTDKDGDSRKRTPKLLNLGGHTNLTYIAGDKDKYFIAKNKVYYVPYNLYRTELNKQKTKEFKALRNKKIVRIVAGEKCAIFISSTGVMYAYGDNKNKRLIEGGPIKIKTPTKIPNKKFIFECVKNSFSFVREGASYTKDVHPNIEDFYKEL